MHHQEPKLKSAPQIAQDSGPLLDVHHLTTSLLVKGELRPVVRDMSLVVEHAEIVGLVGESGSGKSITARSIIGLLPRGGTSTGQILFNGKDILGLDKQGLRKLRSNEIGMIFQDPRSNIDPLWRIEDYVGEGLRVHRGLTKSAARGVSMELLSGLGIVDPERVMQAYPDELSGGMLQRVMIAGTLSCEPQCIVADEATTAVDATVQSDILVILREQKKARAVSVLFITHDLSLASVICDRIVVMYAGRPMSVQPSSELFAAPVHPYAAALVAARPRLERRVDRLLAIAGQPVSALEAEPGCPFRRRCPYAIQECAHVESALVELADGSASQCIRAEEIRGQLREMVQSDA